MKKISTVAIERIQIFKEHQRTIGLDLGDRTPVKDSLLQSSLGFAQGIFAPGGRFRGGLKSAPSCPGPCPCVY